MLALVTGVNLRGIAESARVFVVPTVIFVGAILTVVVAGLLRTEPAATTVTPGTVRSLQTVGILLLLKAFANGCAALTGVEAIANAVPSFASRGSGARSGPRSPWAHSSRSCSWGSRR